MNLCALPSEAQPMFGLDGKLYLKAKGRPASPVSTGGAMLSNSPLRAQHTPCSLFYANS